MKEKKEDRRSKRTRKLLSNALIALMMEKRYNKITVQDIIDRADVGRSTFYAHYQDKDDLLVSDFEDMLNGLEQHLGEDGETTSATFSTLAMFRHVGEHSELYKALIWGGAGEFFFKKIQLHLSKRVEDHLATQITDQEVLPLLPVIANYLVGSFLTLIQWWIDNDRPYSPERMDEIYQQLAMPGVLRLMQPRT